MGELFDFSPELPYQERLSILTRHRVALWDSLAGCERTGSLDSNIRAPEPNDISGLLQEYPTILSIFCNGSASLHFLKKYHANLFFRPELTITQLPSTSPAAAMYSFAEKLNRWHIVKEKTEPQHSSFRPG